MSDFNTSGSFGNNGNGGFGQGGGFGGGGNGGFGQGGGFGGGGGGSFGQGGGFGGGGGGNFGQGGGYGVGGGGGFGSSPVSGKAEKFIPALILTIIYGFLWHFLGEIIVRSLFNKIWNPLAVAVYVLAFTIPLLILLYILSSIAGNTSATLRRWGSGKAAGLLALCILGTFMAALLLEFIYELGGANWNYTPTSYVFVIDDSGSMYSNDPQTLRASAIGEIMKDENIPYCVYKFSDDAVLISDLKSYTDGDSYDFNSDGEYTNILQALYTVAQEIKDPAFKGGDRPKVLLLSDGESDESALEEVMKEYTDQNVSVSTVGFGSVNRRFMKQIAEQTGGVFVNCDNLDALTEDMHEAIISSSSRTLLTPRFNVRNDILYLILRILFLTGIGAMIALCKARGAVSDTDYMRIIVFTSAQGLAAAVICELLVGSSEGLARLLVNILWAATIMTRWVVESQFPAGPPRDPNGIGPNKPGGGNARQVGQGGSQGGTNNDPRGGYSGGSSGWSGGNTGSGSGWGGGNSGTGGWGNGNTGSSGWGNGNTGSGGGWGGGNTGAGGWGGGNSGWNG